MFSLLLLLPDLLYNQQQWPTTTTAAAQLEHQKLCEISYFGCTKFQELLQFGRIVEKKT